MTEKTLTALLVVLCTVTLIGTTCSGADEPTSDGLRNRPELSLPLLDRKLIIAHHMTAWLGWHEAEGHGTKFDPVPAGGPTDVVGTKSVCAMYGLVQEPAVVDLDKAVQRELKSATLMGLDGFQFFYPIHMHDGFLRRYSRIVREFIKQAERTHPSFRVTLCLCAPGSPATEPEMRAQWAEHIRWILKDTADSPIWLRTPDGRLIVYTWVPEGFVDAFRSKDSPHIHQREGIAATALAYEKLAREIGEDIAYIFHMRGSQADWYANLIYDYFPAAWRWAEGNASADVARHAALARKRQRVFSPSVYPGFFGHTYKVGKGMSGAGRGKVGEDAVSELWRPYMKTRQTQLCRDLLESAIAANSPLISFITWNDYTEATHLIPGANYNFAWGVLLNHYRNIWLGCPEKNDREVAIVAFKKHRLDKPLATDIGFRVMTEEDYGTLEEESRVEVVTILDRSADVMINGRKRGTVGAGVVSTSIPFEEGPVHVQVQRNGEDVLVLRPSERATDAPRRNDSVSVVLSTEFNRYFRELFGEDAQPYRLREYAR